MQVSFAIYITAFAILPIGLIYGPVLVHVPAHWIIAGGIVLVGVRADRVKATRQKDSAP